MSDRRLTWCISVAGACVFGLLGFLCLNRELATVEDDGVYIQLAEALAKGKGYQDIARPSESPHVHYPFLFPAMLSPLVWAFCGHVAAYKLLPLLFGCLTVACIPFWLSDRPVSLRVGATIVLVANPLFLSFATVVMPETALMFLVFLSSALVRRLCAAPSSPRWLTGAAIASMLATCFVKSIGLCCVLAGVAFLCVCRRYRLAVLLGVAVLVPVALWQARCFVLSSAAEGQGDYLREWFDTEGGRTRAMRPGDDQPLFSFQRMVLQRRHNLALLANCLWWSWLPSSMAECYANDCFPYFWHRIVSGDASRNPVAPYVIWSLLLVGFAACVRRRLDITDWYVIGYVAMFLAWSRPHASYVMPLIPFLLRYGLEGALAVGASLSPQGRWTALLPWGVAFALVACNAPVAAPLLEHNWEYRRACQSEEGIGLYSRIYRPRWAVSFAASDYLRNHSDRDDVIMYEASAADVFYVHNGRRVLTMPWSATAVEVDKALASGLTHVVGFPRSPRTRGFLTALGQRRDVKAENMETFTLSQVTCGVWRVGRQQSSRLGSDRQSASERIRGQPSAAFSTQ